MKVNLFFLVLLASLLSYYAGKRVADKWWKAHCVVGYNGEYWNLNKGTEPRAQGAAPSLPLTIPDGNGGIDRQKTLEHYTSFSDEDRAILLAR